MLFKWWTTICDAGLTFKQHWVYVSCLQGYDSMHHHHNRPYTQMCLQMLMFNHAKTLHNTYSIPNNH